MAETSPPRTLNSKRERPYLGYAVNRNRQIRYTSAKQILLFDDRQEGCPRKWANAFVFGRKTLKTDAQVEGVSLAELLEIYLTTGTMVLPPVLQPTAKFFPKPQNPETEEFDLLCEEPLGDIARAVELRDKILQSPRASNLAEAQVELRRLAGLTARGIPFDGAADCVHYRNTYVDKEGVVRPEPAGVRAVGIGDLKSTSRINTHVTVSTTLQGWAQTDAEVCSDPQMLSYGKHRLDLRKDLTHARLNKIYAQKKPHLAEIRGGLVSRQQVDDGWGALEERVFDEMVQVATAASVADVRPAPGSCNAFTHVEPCPYPGCGVGCLPGKVVVNLVGASQAERECPGCKGKGRTAKGCAWRGTDACPMETAQFQIPINLDFDNTRVPITGAGMSLFDRVGAEPGDPTTVPVAPLTPRPPMDQAFYDAQVATEIAAVEAEMGGALVAPVPPAPPVAPTPPAASVAPTLGEEISVSLCAVGDEYMVDCEDGHSPYRMKFTGVSAGVFKFVDALGGKGNLEVTDHVWRLPAGAAPTTPVPPPQKVACGAKGCGEGCAPGYVRTDNASAFLMCNACGGKGAVSAETTAIKPPDAPKTQWLDQQAPLSDEEIARMKADPTTDPKLLELAVEHKRIHEERQRAEDAADAAAKGTARGGNCPGSGQPVVFAQQPSVVSGKVVCPHPGCGQERPIPKEIRKASPRPDGMPFPNHRKKAAPAAPTPPGAPVPPAAPAPVPVPPAPPVAPVPPAPPVPPVAPTPPPVRDVTPGIQHTIHFKVDGVLLTKEEVDVLAGLFRDRALAIPRAALAPETVALLKKLKLVD